MRRVMAVGSLVVATILAIIAPSVAEERSWSGVYGGASLGWANTSYSSELQGFPGSLLAGDHRAAIGGLHLGVQKQFGQFLLGIEGSYAKTAPGFGNRIPGGTPNCLGSAVGGFLFSCDAQLKNLFLLGPRAGWTPNKDWLLYATGGVASGVLTDRATLNSTGATVGLTEAAHIGRFIGGGVEHALSPNWIVGIEYLHVDFGSKFRCEKIVAGGCNAGESRTGSADSDVVRARVSYKFALP